MKKVEKRYQKKKSAPCPNCPKKIGKNREDTGKTHGIISVDEKIARVKKAQHLLQKQKEHLKKQKRHKIRQKRRQKAKEEEAINQTKSLSILNLTHTVYHGLDPNEDLKEIDLNEGDLFVNTLTGNWQIFSHSIWKKLHQTHSTPKIFQELPQIKDGSFYFDKSNNQFYSFSGGKWIKQNSQPHI